MFTGFRYGTVNGIQGKEFGHLRDYGLDAKGKPIKNIVVDGAWTYIAPDGNRYLARYSADEHGYRVTPYFITPKEQDEGTLADHNVSDELFNTGVLFPEPLNVPWGSDNDGRKNGKVQE